MTDLTPRWPERVELISTYEMQGRELILRTPLVDVYGPGDHDGNNYDILTISSVDYWFWGRRYGSASEATPQRRQRFERGDHTRKDMATVLIAAKLLGLNV